jgi:glycerol-3-phosphate acyltransferase PlsX
VTSSGLRAKGKSNLNASITVALDAMGGDHAPDMVVEGADMARTRYPKVRYIFFGDESRIAPLLEKRKALREIASIHHTSEAISSDAKPSIALRSGRQSSMTARGESVMLDLGANIECDADNLVQFAIMGSIFASAVLGIPEPTIGLLNVGTEQLKGSDSIRAAADTLRANPVSGIFHGFIEGNDIPAGTVDVVVTDGFTGNVALKLAEGMGKLYSGFMQRIFRSSLLAGLGYMLAIGAFRKLRARVDPRRYNGGMFLGLSGVCVKSHGGIDAFGFANAVGVAVDLVAQGFNERIGVELERLSPPVSVAQQQ